MSTPYTLAVIRNHLVTAEAGRISSFLDDSQDWLDRRRLHLSIHQDFDRFIPLFERLGEIGAFAGFRVAPTGFWFEVRRDDLPVATYAAYLMPLIGTLKEHVEDRGWYDGAQDRWRFHGEANRLAESISGTVMFNGGIAVHRDYRSKGRHRALRVSLDLLPRMSMIGRVLGYGLFGADGGVFMAKEGNMPIKAGTGPQAVAESVEWITPSGVLGPRSLGWTSSQVALARALAARPER